MRIKGLCHCDTRIQYSFNTGAQIRYLIYLVENLRSKLCTDLEKDDKLSSLVDSR